MKTKKISVMVEISQEAFTYIEETADLQCETFSEAFEYILSQYRETEGDGNCYLDVHRDDLMQVMSKATKANRLL